MSAGLLQPPSPAVSRCQKTTTRATWASLTPAPELPQQLFRTRTYIKHFLEIAEQDIENRQISLLLSYRLSFSTFNHWLFTDEKLLKGERLPKYFKHGFFSFFKDHMQMYSIKISLFNILFYLSEGWFKGLIG